MDYSELKILEVKFMRGRMNIMWGCPGIGYGWVGFFAKNDTIEAWTERMATQEDKSFLKALLAKFAEMVEVVE